MPVPRSSGASEEPQQLLAVAGQRLKQLVTELTKGESSTPSRPNFQVATAPSARVSPSGPEHGGEHPEDAAADDVRVVLAQHELT